jgi:phosphoesterase RecJ-like protein
MVIDDNVPDMYRFLPDIGCVERFDGKAIDADLLVILDVGEASRTGMVFQHFKGSTLNIDHHLSNRAFANWVHVDETASATGLILYRMFHDSGTHITKDIATCLYTAIATDCGYFRYANTDEETLSAAAHLTGLGANPYWISERIEERPVSKVVALSSVLNTLELAANGKIASISVPTGINSSDVEDTESFIDHPRNIIGVELAIMFKQNLEKGNVKISFRSKTVDVSSFAARFNGGGHSRAAGCTIPGSLDQVKKQVLSHAIRYVEGNH